VIGPLVMILIYTLVFSAGDARPPTGVDSAFCLQRLLCAGLLPWNFFVDTITRLRACSSPTAT